MSQPERKVRRPRCSACKQERHFRRSGAQLGSQDAIVSDSEQSVGKSTCASKQERPRQSGRSGGHDVVSMSRSGKVRGCP